jgi:hypothetical protein
MMYSTSWTDIKNIVQWLRSGDESHWEEKIRSLLETVSELKELGHPPPHESPGPSAESKVFSPEANAINVAMPQLIKMLEAMRDHNREAALEHGQTALGLLPDE